MKISKVEAFYREFPWLVNHISKDEIGEIRVSRIDLELFRRKRATKEIDNIFWDDTVPCEALYALDKSGLSVGQVGYVLLPTGGGFLGRKPKWGDDLDDTLEKLFGRLGSQAPQIKFVVSLSESNVIIYKAPKDKSVLAYIEEEIQKAQEDVREEVKAVDVD